jgi:hypothetical protein
MYRIALDGRLHLQSIINQIQDYRSDSRTELRCKGLIGRWDEAPRTKKIKLLRQTWSEEERKAMR